MSPAEGAQYAQAWLEHQQRQADSWREQVVHKEEILRRDGAHLTEWQAFAIAQLPRYRQNLAACEKDVAFLRLCRKHLRALSA